jgi:hypothetical protein
MFIFLAYWYNALRYTPTKPEEKTLPIVLVNTLVAELFFWLTYSNTTFAETFGFWRLLGFLCTLELAYYVIHAAFHTFPPLHRLHEHNHAYYGAVYAWYSHPVGHVLLNLIPMYVALYLFPEPFWCTVLLWITYCWYVVYNNCSGSGAALHHVNSSKNFGLIGLPDWLFGTK